MVQVISNLDNSNSPPFVFVSMLYLHCLFLENKKYLLSSSYLLFGVYTTQHWRQDGGSACCNVSKGVLGKYSGVYSLCT